MKWIDVAEVLSPLPIQQILSKSIIYHISISRSLALSPFESIPLSALVPLTPAPSGSSLQLPLGLQLPPALKSLITHRLPSFALSPRCTPPRLRPFHPQHTKNPPLLSSRSRSPVQTYFPHPPTPFPPLARSLSAPPPPLSFSFPLPDRWR